MVQLAFRETRTWLGKFLFVLAVLSHFLLFAIPNMLLHELGVRNNHATRFRLRRIITAPRIWIAEYVMPVASSNVLVIQGKDGGLLLRSPPEPTPAVVQAIRDQGEPTALLVSLSHDTFADKWKHMFPDAIVIAQREDIPAINNRVKVDLALEDAEEFLKNFYVVRTISTAEWTRFEDAVLILELKPGKLAASFGCGFVNDVESMWSPLYWRNALVGITGFGIKRIFAYLFARNPEKAQSMWQEIADIPGLDTLIFLHGEPIIDADIKSIMSKVNLAKMKFAK